MPGPPPPPPAGLLLTGGASQRMGRDKAALIVAGVPLAEHTAALLREIADLVVEVGPGFTTLACVSEEPAGEGPLAAVAAGAGRLPDHRAALVVATDLPRLTAAFLRKLAGFPVPNGDYSVVPVDGSGRAQYLCARYSPAALARARRLVAEGRRAMRDLVAEVPFVTFNAGSDDLVDVDTAADLDRIGLW